jgi:hypothetical protein
MYEDGAKLERVAKSIHWNAPNTIEGVEEEMDGVVSDVPLAAAVPLPDVMAAVLAPVISYIPILYGYGGATRSSPASHV